MRRVARPRQDQRRHIDARELLLRRQVSCRSSPQHRREECLVDRGKRLGSIREGRRDGRGGTELHESLDTVAFDELRVRSVDLGLRAAGTPCRRRNHEGQAREADRILECGVQHRAGPHRWPHAVNRFTGSDGIQHRQEVVGEVVPPVVERILGPRRATVAARVDAEDAVIPKGPAEVKTEVAVSAAAGHQTVQLDDQRTVITGHIEVECGASNPQRVHVPSRASSVRNGCRLDYARCA